MSNFEQQYLDLARAILSDGEHRPDRTGTGTISLFGRQVRHSMALGFPLLTTKKVYYRMAFEEMLWFLSGSSNVKPLIEKKISIWTDWAFQHFVQEDDTYDDGILREENGRWMTETEIYQDALSYFEDQILADAEFAAKWGDLGPVYGVQWRRWATGRTIPTHYEGYQASTRGGRVAYGEEVIDQIANLVDGLKNNPYSRRHMVTAWNPAELEEMMLPPCHYGFQCYVRGATMNERYVWLKDNEARLPGYPGGHEGLSEADVPEKALDLHMTKRSTDLALGAPFNASQYALLLHMLAQQCGYVPGELTITFGDVHIYKNHVDGIKEQLQRSPSKLPRLKIRRADSIFDYTYDDFEIVDYEPSSSIKYDVAV